MAYNLDTDVSEGDTKRALYHCFDLWRDAELISISQNGSDAHVVFEWRGQPVRVSYALQRNFKSNLRAIYLTLDAMRLAYARGLGDILTGTVSQMLKLGAGARTIDPYELLGIRPGAPLEVAEAAYKALARSAHPDAGGSTEQMQELNDAIEKIRAAKAE